jgi:hypothetical protein
LFVDGDVFAKPGCFQVSLEQSALFMQHHLQFWKVVSNLRGAEQSPTGCHERERELVQLPAAAAVKDQTTMVAWISCTVGNALEGEHIQKPRCLKEEVSWRASS